MRGFFRIIALENNDGLGEVREGKDPMTFQLYRLVSLWMIELGSDDGIWGHLFLVLTWNLMCRVNNTSQICLCYMEWADDALRIYFANSKTDRFNTAVESNSRLFPGHHQFKRFANLLKQVLRSHEDELLDLGICWEDLGTHSIRKGAATYVSSCPGGPSSGAISVRGDGQWAK